MTELEAWKRAATLLANLKKDKHAKRCDLTKRGETCTCGVHEAWKAIEEARAAEKRAQTYPTPWRYNEDENWIERDLDDGGLDDGYGEIWCEFKEHPPTELEWLLEVLNEAEEEG